jgi:hypothetical protein
MRDDDDDDCDERRATATTTTTMATTTMMATARQKGDDPMEGRPSTILWRYLLTKIALCGWASLCATTQRTPHIIHSF